MSGNATQTAGARLYIGGKTASDTVTEYDALTWVEVGEVISWGEFGKTFQLVSYNPTGDRRTRKLKGTYNNGSLQLTLARIPDDEGQDDLRGALDDTEGFNFKIAFDDAPAGGDPTRMFFNALVMSYTANLAGADAVVQASATLEIDSDILEAAAGT